MLDRFDPGTAVAQRFRCLGPKVSLVKFVEEFFINGFYQTTTILQNHDQIIDLLTFDTHFISMINDM